MLLGFDADGRRVRKKVSGQTKTEVKDKLKALHSELDAGVRSAAGYTVEKAVADWLKGHRDLQEGVGRSRTQFPPHGGPQPAELTTVIMWCMG